MQSSREYLRNKVNQLDKIEVISMIFSNISVRFNVLLNFEIANNNLWIEKNKDEKQEIRDLVADLNSLVGVSKPLSGENVHVIWSENITKKGWNHSVSYDYSNKTHPWLQDFSSLPNEVQDYYNLCAAVYLSLRGLKMETFIHISQCEFTWGSDNLIGVTNASPSQT